MARSWARWFISWPTSASGISSSTSSASASPVRSRTAAWAWALRTIGRPVADRVAQLVDGLELGVLGRPGVVGVGQHPLAHLLTRTLNRSWRSSSGSGWVASNSRMSPALAPRELLVDLGGDGLAADRVAVVVGGEAVLGLAVQRAGDVDGDRVALPGRAARRRRRSPGPGACGRSGRRSPRRRARAGGSRPAGRRSPGTWTTGRTSTTASKATGPSSSPAVMSIWGASMASTSLSDRAWA